MNDGPAGIAHRLAEHIVGLRFEDIPAEVLDHARRLIIDTVGVAWAGSTAPGSDALERMVLEEAGRGSSSLWVSGRRVDAASAAFLNSVYAAALDYDSVYEKGSVHPDIVSVPVAWAMAERQRASGRELLASIVVANDLMCRLAAAAEPKPGWFNTSLFGVFGAAAAAARLTGLDAAAARHALGLALSQTGGTQQALIEKTMAKRVQSGFAARGGVFSALLAAQGVTAPAQCFEGDYGFYRMYGAGDAMRLLDGLGEHFLNTATAIKKYPSCTANHVPVELLIGILEEFDLAPSDVQAIKARVSPFAHRLVGAPFEPGDNPQVAAQFSLEYSLACAVLRRRLTVADIQEEAVRDAAIADFIRRISIDIDPGNAGKFAPAEVSVDTARHGRIQRRLEHVPGAAESPLSRTEVEAKFRACTTSGARPLSDEQRNRLLTRLAAIDTVSDMAGFFEQV